MNPDCSLREQASLEMITSQNLDDIQMVIGRRFENPHLIARALIHNSCCKQPTKGMFVQSNERLEFLGDGLLDGAIGVYLCKNFPNESENILGLMKGRLRSNHLLGIIADQLGLARFLILFGQAIFNFNGSKKLRNKMLADVFEAIIGALFLDGGFEAVGYFLEQTLFPHAEEVRASLGKPLFEAFELVGL